MLIKLYEPKYRSDIESLLKEFAKEIWDNSGDNVDVDCFVRNHWCVYVAIATSGEVIGFSSYNLNHYYGMRDATVSNTFIYVVKEHRQSRAMYLFSLQSGKICVSNNLGLEHHYGSDESRKLSSKLNGAKLYETFVYPLDEVSRVFSRLKSKIRIKE